MKIGKSKHIFYNLDFSNPEKNIRFYLNNQLISNEWVYIPTYIKLLEDFIENIKNNLFNSFDMEQLPAEHRLEKIIKEKESNEKQYFNHLFQLDETIDQYNMFIFQSMNIIDLNWKCWDKNNCNSDHKLNQVYNVLIHKDEVINECNELIFKLKYNSYNNI